MSHSARKEGKHLEVSAEHKVQNNDHPRDPEIVAVVDKWSLLRGNSMPVIPNWDAAKYCFFSLFVNAYY